MQTSTTNPSIVDNLRASIRGARPRPGRPGYDKARVIVMGGFDPRPAVIVRVADADDVATAIRAARDGGLELAVRSGGHSGAAHGTVDGGLVIDVRDLKSLEIDAAGQDRLGRLGLTAGEYSNAAAAARPCDGLRRHRLGRPRRNHARRRRRLPRPQVRPDDRLPPRGRDRDGRRPVLQVDADNAPGPVLGDPRRRRQLRRRNAVQVPPRRPSASSPAACSSCQQRPRRSPASSPRPRPPRRSCRRSRTSCPHRRCRSFQRRSTASSRSWG